MPEAVVALGANLGDSVRALAEAADDLDAVPGVTVKARSRFYTTSPVDSSGPDYVNAAVLIETSLTPLQLLRACQQIENAHGRVRPAGVVNAPRTLDLDVISYEGVEQDDPVLYVLSGGETLPEAIARVGKTHPDQQIRLLAEESVA